MFFKRSNGEFRETDRVTRFKLVKSGKTGLRAATSNFGLFESHSRSSRRDCCS